MAPDFPSKIELYYTSPEMVYGEHLKIVGEEVKHISMVMRHKPGDVIFVTCGNGSLYELEINELEKKVLTAKILKSTFYPKAMENIVFCIPRLKNNDRFEFALEKCIELGIHRFIVFDADNSVAKGDKSERWNKVALSSMKQCLRFYKPEIQYIKKLENLSRSSRFIIFEQEHTLALNAFIENNKQIMLNNSEEFYFIFGPEGGLSSDEIKLFNDAEKVKLTCNRLRSETAIISAASVLSVLLKN